MQRRWTLNGDTELGTNGHPTPRSNFLRWGLASLSVALFASCVTPPATNRNGAAPRLVVLLVVDQLRGDYDRLYPNAAKEPGGLTSLRRSGANYSLAMYSHSSTRTAPGHATIVTGVNPNGHGIVANDWYDRAAGKRIQAVQDDDATLIGSRQDDTGVSPKNLTVPTVGDALILAGGGDSRVISISAKDRGAILPGGHLGKAFWFHPDSGRFVTSSYYGLRELPEWVSTFNETMQKQLPSTWALLDNNWRYRYADDRPMELGRWGLGNTFPHALPSVRNTDYFDALKRTPMMDELTLELAQRAIASEGLGSNAEPDFLAVSLSSTDYVNHAFGVLSTEAEDNIRRLNRSLAAFIEYVQNTVGRDNVTFVLTADHGGDDIPEYRQSIGGAGHRVIVPEIFAAANAHLSDLFKTPAPLLAAFTAPNVYLDDAAIRDNALDRGAVLAAASDYFASIPGIQAVAAENRSLAEPLASLVRQATYPVRSGDMIVLQSDATFLGYPGYAATHGSPDHHDRHVALMFYGAGVPRRTSSEFTDMTRVAPTIARCLRTPAPGAATGTALPGICESFD